MTDVVAGIAEVLSGRSVTALLETLKSDDPLEKIRSAKSLQDQVAEFLESLLAERGNRLVVIIDELDRCNPKFAIRLLERIKHYFNNSRVTFVFALNVAELQHSIRNYYGNGFDATRYHAIFIEQYNGQNYSTEIGKISIRRDSKDIILRTVSGLSDFADFEV